LELHDAFCRVKNASDDHYCDHGDQWEWGLAVDVEGEVPSRPYDAL